MASNLQISAVQSQDGEIRSHKPFKHVSELVRGAKSTSKRKSHQFRITARADLVGAFSSCSLPPGVELRLGLGAWPVRSRTCKRGAAGTAACHVGDGRPRSAACPAAHHLGGLGNVREAGILPQPDVWQIKHTRRVLQFERLSVSSIIVGKSVD